MTEKVEFSRDSLLMFAELLGELSVPATHPHLERLAIQISTARRELEDALKAFPVVVPVDDEPAA